MCPCDFVGYLARYASSMDKKPRATTSRDSDKYIVRFVDGLKERIEQSATSNNRSINAEINSRLQESFELAQRVRDMESEIADLQHDLGYAEERAKIERTRWEEVTSINAQLRENAELASREATGIEAIPAILQRIEAEILSQRETINAMAGNGVEANLYPDGKVKSVQVTAQKNRAVRISYEPAIVTKLREKGELPPSRPLSGSIGRNDGKTGDSSPAKTPRKQLLEVPSPLEPKKRRATLKGTDSIAMGRAVEDPLDVRGNMVKSDPDGRFEKAAEILRKYPNGPKSEFDMLAEAMVKGRRGPKKK